MDPVRQRAATALVVVVAAAVSMVGWSGWHWWHNHPPFGPEVLAARVTLSYTDQATADAALRPDNSVIANEGDRIALGRLTWTTPSASHGVTLRIVMVDTRTHRTPTFFAVHGPEPRAVIVGSDGSPYKAMKRYSWLHIVDPDPTMITVATLTASPVIFQTTMRD